MTEIWKPIPEYEHYEVSDLGRVKSVLKSKMTPANHILKPLLAGKGYQAVCLYKGGKMKRFYVHRLVLLAFAGPWRDGIDVNHKDAIKTNNSLSNLEYCTKKANTNHAWNLGLMPKAPTLRGSECVKAKIDEPVAYKIKEMIRGGYTNMQISQILNVARSTVENVKADKVWRHVKLRPEPGLRADR